MLPEQPLLYTNGLVVLLTSALGFTARGQQQAQVVVRDCELRGGLVVVRAGSNQLCE
jgi:hypothetical protein